MRPAAGFGAVPLLAIAMAFGSCAAAPRPATTTRAPRVVAPSTEKPPAAPEQTLAATPCEAPSPRPRSPIDGVELSEDGHWALGRGEVTQVWALGPGAHSLRHRIELPYPTFASNDHIVVDDGRDMVAIDLARGAVVRLADVSVAGPVAGGWIAAGPGHLRVLEPRDLHVVSEVPLGPVPPPVGLDEVHLLRGGRRVVTDVALLALDPPRVLVADRSMRALSADESRVAACDREGRALSILSTETGEAVASFPADGTRPLCGFPPYLSPDGSHVVVLDQAEDGSTRLWTADVTTGAVRATSTRHFIGSTLSVELHPSPDDPRRICLGAFGKLEASTTCAWELRPDGSIAPAVDARPHRVRVGEGGVASARSPSRAWRVVARIRAGRHGVTFNIDRVGPGRSKVVSLAGDIG